MVLENHAVTEPARNPRQQDHVQHALTCVDREQYRIGLGAQE
jgi:hypothetical protein